MEEISSSAEELRQLTDRLLDKTKAFRMRLKLCSEFFFVFGEQFWHDNLLILVKAERSFVKAKICKDYFMKD